MKCEHLRKATFGSIAVISEVSFKGCTGHEYCLFNETAYALRIEEEAFAHCHLLKLFCIVKRFEGNEDRCFRMCGSLFVRGFASGESVKKIVRGLAFDEGLEQQSANASFPIFTRTASSAIKHASSPSQFLNPKSPIISTEAGIVIVVKNPQPENADEPICLNFEPASETTLSI
jgi:hypothetical protein